MNPRTVYKPNLIIDDLTVENAQVLETPSLASHATRKDYVDAVTRTVVTDASYTILAGDRLVGVTRTATGTCALTLPLAASVSAGKMYRIKDEARNAGTFSITVSPSGADTVEGAASLTLNSDGTSVSLYSDGVSAWFIF